MTTTTTHPSTTTQAGWKTFETRSVNNHNEKLVGTIKETAAKLWTEIDSISIAPGNSEAGRLVSLAKTELEATVMWAVKAISRT